MKRLHILIALLIVGVLVFAGVEVFHLLANRPTSAPKHIALEPDQTITTTAPQDGPPPLPEDVPGLADILQNGDPEARLQAARRLVEMNGGSAEAVPALIAVLEETRASTGPELREVVAEALEKLGSTAIDAAPVLMDELDGSRSSEDAVVAALGAIKPADVTPLVGGMCSMQPMVHTQAVAALIAIGESVIPAMDQALRDENSGCRERAAWVLSKLGPAAVSCLPNILPLLEETDRDIRRIALNAVRNIGPGHCLDELIGYLGSTDSSFRKDVAGVIATVGGPAVPSLLAAIDEGGIVRESAVNALAAMDPAPPEIVPAMFELAASAESEDVFHLATGALARVGVGGAMALVEGLHDERPQVRRSAARALRSAGFEEVDARDELLQLLDDATPAVREEAAGTLAGKQYDDAITAEALALRLAAEDEPKVRERLLGALGAHGPVSVAPLIENWSVDGPAELRVSILNAFPQMKPSGESALDLVETALEDEVPAVRLAAAGTMDTLARWWFDDEESENAASRDRFLALLNESLPDADNAVAAALAGTARKVGVASGELVAMLEEADEARRLAVVRQLHRLHGVAAPALVHALGDTSAEVRRGAAWSLRLVLREAGKKQEDLDAVLNVELLDALEAASDDRDPIVREQAHGLRTYYAPMPPDLLAGALGEDENARIRAFVHLSAMGDEAKPILEQIVTALRQGDETERRGAVFALAHVPARLPGSVEALQSALDSNDDYMRRHAVTALGLVGPDAAIAAPRLIALWKQLGGPLKGPRAKNRSRETTPATPPDPIMEALLKMGPEAAAQVAPLLQQDDAEMRQRALLFLGRARPVAPESVSAIDEALRDADAKVRASAAEALAMIGDSGEGSAVEAALPSLLAGLKDEDPTVRQNCLVALNRSIAQDREVEVGALVPALIQILEGDDARSKRLAVNTLANIRPVPVEAVEPLVRFFIDDNAFLDQGPVIRALFSIQTVPPEAIGTLVDAIPKTSDSMKLTQIASLIAAIEPPPVEAVPVLVAALQNPGNRHARKAIAGALSRFKADVVPVLLPCLDSEDTDTLYYTMQLLALQKTNAAEALPKLQGLRKHEDGIVRRGAEDAIRQIEGK